LSGLIVGLLAQGMEPYDAAVAGAHIHASAGAIAAEDMGSRAVIAGDILESLVEVLVELEMLEGFASV
jgi:NAD(P)H-hydrate epimerase